eukprot:CAMPEP_0183291140 /NCGR_PEP_ID=MMETSP0160_2-20130417/658_1 /TAXON_ID=2839 ORGANISM="Odontella Sinensis, Strain Grunow 1884" /NCGR_SAMPLE_ID=MMETSP0160_2 /ASSEMBLY_ACC=CAM_ASM_000250 /LENGTH=279 /DNA_ID=CAMNT_0025451899 /DNA_START=17 /DNA_END=856 /DNA_ORIENTATION=-
MSQYSGTTKEKRDQFSERTDKKNEMEGRKGEDRKLQKRRRKGGGGGGRRADGGSSDKAISKALSWALRHAAPSLGLTMSTDGYVAVDSLLSCNHPRFRRGGWSEEDVRRVVETNDKQRFRLEVRPRAEGKREEVLCIRANQGHSIPSVVCDDLLERISPDELREMTTIVHGTYAKPWEEHIRHDGLSRMKRNHIHFASGLPEGDGGVISGMRSTCQIYIYVNGARCAEDGVPFYRSDNGVLLTPGASDGMLPVQYFSRVIDARTKEILLNDGEQEQQVN